MAGSIQKHFLKWCGSELFLNPLYQISLRHLSLLDTTFLTKQMLLNPLLATADIQSNEGLCLMPANQMFLLWVILCWYIFSLASRGASITEGPSPMTSEVGLDVNITCKISMKSDEREAFRWSRIVDAGNPQGEPIYTYPMEDLPKKSKKYQILRNGQNFDLRILNLDFYDGGLYHCQAVLAAQIKGAPLVVLSECIEYWDFGILLIFPAYSPFPFPEAIFKHELQSITFQENSVSL